MKKNLTDAFCRKVKPDPEKNLDFFDGTGMRMFFRVYPTGRKTFRLKYRLPDGGESSISLGVYPVCSLREAREEAIETLRLVKQGINPSKERKKAKERRIEGRRDTFKKFAEAWFSVEKSKWKSKKHQKYMAGLLEKKLYPQIGDTPIKEITRPQVLDILTGIAEEGYPSVVGRLRQCIYGVFKLAIDEEKVENNPAVDLTDRLPKRPKVKHRVAIISPKKLGSLLLDIDGYEGGGKSVVKYALRLMPLVFVRSKEMRFAEWKEIDWDESLWCLDATKMKTGEDHVVPLSRQAVKILKDVRRYTGNGRYVFANRDFAGKPISEHALLYALGTRIAKEEMLVHGFRATARTLIREKLKQPIDWIEVQLAHAPRDPLGHAYDRALYLDDRAEMMQKWADYLDQLKQEAKAEASRE